MRSSADTLLIQILWFEETFSTKSANRGVEVFSYSCAVLDFVGPVFAALHQILLEEGIAGYKRRWKNAEFPIEIYNELQRLLTPSAQK